jgi:alkanesulfonate monooxygenase SsuD/methylene tetrahydromethanopterin reductase-like flavin-dependent oxidoreductase (luciferase family)
MAPKKQLSINFFDMSCASNHMAIGLWRSPNDISHTKDTIEYYTWLAKLAEKGKISTIFFADAYGCDEIYEDDYSATLKGGSTVAALDPMVWISAMAAVTKSVGFALTASTSYINVSVTLLTAYVFAKVGRNWGKIRKVP